MARALDLTGMRFGRLTVIDRAPNIVGPAGCSSTRWKCICDCGNTTTVKTSNLRMGETKSCGCYAIDTRRKNGSKRKIHGGFGTRLYNIYYKMIDRCCNKKSHAYKSYGERGICICDEWMGKDGFVKFMEWSLKNGYKNGLSIDRIDNNRGYSPENCRWATPKEQQNNRRCNVFLAVNGKTHTIAEWSRISGINVATLYNRHKAGWDDYDVIYKPVDRRKATSKKGRITKKKEIVKVKQGGEPQ